MTHCFLPLKNCGRKYRETLLIHFDVIVHDSVTKASFDVSSFYLPYLRLYVYARVCVCRRRKGMIKNDPPLSKSSQGNKNIHETLLGSNLVESFFENNPNSVLLSSFVWWGQFFLPYRQSFVDFDSSSRNSVTLKWSIWTSWCFWKKTTRKC